VEKQRSLNGLIHASKATLAALAERAHWLTVEWPPEPRSETVQRFAPLGSNIKQSGGAPAMGRIGEAVPEGPRHGGTNACSGTAE
jgi:hypothetical protein